MKEPVSLKSQNAKLLRLMVLFLFMFVSTIVNAQLTEKDLKLLLDGKDYSMDSTIALETILNTKEVTANFSWLTIQEFSIFIDYRSNADTAKGVICQLPGLASCSGSVICEHARNIMKDLQPGNLIIFQVQKAVNRSGYVLKMADLTLRIR